MPKPEPQSAVQSHIICATCLHHFSEAEAHAETRRLFTDNFPFSDHTQAEALTKEAALLMNFAEAVSSLAESCDDTCNQYTATLFMLITLLSEEAQHRLTEVALIRESRASIPAGRVQS